MEVSIYSVTTQVEGQKPVVKRFSSLKKACEYACIIAPIPGQMVLIGNETCVLDE